MILYVSDFDLNGSGYMNIGTRLCADLTDNHGLDIKALGFAYDGREHKFPFSIVPVRSISHIPDMVRLMGNYGVEIEAVIVALDILLQENILDAMQIPNTNFPYIGLFPLEAPPLCQPWAMQMTRMDACLVMTEFGKQALADAGIESTFIPFGVHDAQLWRPPGDDERQMIRQGLGIEPDEFIILTVADNQERKNLSRAAEIISKFAVDIESRTTSGIVTQTKEKRKCKWYIVTRPDSPVGWKLDDLGLKQGIFDRMAIFNRGMPDQKLWALYAAADCFLLPSKAEGLAIPALEAMACRLPVVATDCTAMREHLQDGRGWLIKQDYQYIDPFGNGIRYWASIEDGVRILNQIADEPPSIHQPLVLDQAQAYVNERTWANAGQIMAGIIRDVINDRRKQQIQLTGSDYGKTQALSEAERAANPAEPEPVAD